MPVPTTIAAYDAFILYPAHRYDIKGKRILKQEKKYYAVDLGMRRILCSNNVRDIGRLLENVVFLELMVVPEFLRTLVFARPRGDDQFADCTFSPSLDMSR